MNEPLDIHKNSVKAGSVVRKIFTDSAFNPPAGTYLVLYIGNDLQDGSPYAHIKEMDGDEFKANGKVKTTTRVYKTHPDKFDGYEVIG